MSEPHSEGRLSVSTRSSYTLNSRYSGSHADNGEGSSTQRASLAGSGRNSEGRNTSAAASSRDAESPLRSESIDEQDFAHRKQRNRKSGGFLLDSTFPSGPNQRSAHSRAHVDDSNRKHTSRHRHHRESNHQQTRSHAVSGSASHSSPLSRQVVTIDEPRTEDGTSRGTPSGGEQGGLRVPKTRKDSRERLSAANLPNNDGSRASSFDPNELVHMALNLSEGRRRNLTAGQMIGPQTPDARRVRSSIAPQSEGSFRNQGGSGSLRQYLNEQRRISRNISPRGGRGSPAGMRYMSSPLPRSMSISVQGQEITPSPATIARRDKARAYIELRMEYLRLLELLPPLKPDSSAPGNYVVTANNVPGSPQAQLTRTPSHANAKYDLGRAYNPLQYLRNRRCRARERVVLSHGSEEFADLDLVKDWVDRVELEAGSPSYRQQDRVQLPGLHEDHQDANVPSKPTRPRVGWIFTPEELFADALWTEQSTNKTLIEDRHGRKIFPSMETHRPDALQSRISREYTDNRRKSWGDDIAAKLGPDTATEDESDRNSVRGRRKRLLPAFRSESPKHKKHGWRSSRPQSANRTDPSDSDSDSPKQRSRKSRRIIDINNNTGPLELRIQEMLEKEQEAKDRDSRSPMIISPDTPDKWGTGTGTSNPPAPNQPRDSLEVPTFSNGFVKGNSSRQDLKAPPRMRSDLIFSSDPVNDPRSSFEDLDSTAPSTPLHPKVFPHIGTDLSPPPSRGESVKKTKKSKFDLFRSDESTKSHRLDPDSAGTDKQKDARQSFEEAPEGLGLGTTILAAPGAVKALLTHKKNESFSSLPSPEAHRKDHKESREFREPPSAVTRFFKGVKNEGSKVGEFIFRRDRPTEDSDTDSDISEKSDVEDNDSKPQKKTGLNRTSTAATAESTTSGNGNYHLELPSFRSYNQTDLDNASVSDSYLSDDHVSRQARARANSRSPRFDKLAPPPIDLSSISAHASPDISRPQSPDAIAAEKRLSKVLARPGGVGQAGQPITSLAHPQISEYSETQRGASRPRLDSNRHWSITDDNGNVLHRSVTPHDVTQTDIARVRALWLCSGVKAREIARKAHAQREEPPQFLKRTADAVSADIIPVSRQEEHVLAARMLVQDLESSTQALQVSAQQFKDSTIKELTSRMSEIKSRVESELFPRVRENGDEAVRITSEVSGTAPLTVKQITDEIDKMIRMRRRRMRYMRRIGWMLVEWMLLGVMWWVWLIVVVLGFFRKLFGVFWRILKWLLWL